MTPSKNHPNRRAYNWITYALHDRSLARHAGRLAGRVYDLGSGSGCYKRWCLDQAAAYVAVDWPGSLHGGAVDIVADLNQKLPIADAVADSVICFSVLEHLHEPRGMLSETARILRPGRLSAPTGAVAMVGT